MSSLSRPSTSFSLPYTSSSRLSTPLSRPSTPLSLPSTHFSGLFTSLAVLQLFILLLYLFSSNHVFCFSFFSFLPTCFASHQQISLRFLFLAASLSYLSNFIHSFLFHPSSLLFILPHFSFIVFSSTFLFAFLLMSSLFSAVERLSVYVSSSSLSLLTCIFLSSPIRSHIHSRFRTPMHHP